MSEIAQGVAPQDAEVPTTNSPSTKETGNISESKVDLQAYKENLPILTHIVSQVESKLIEGIDNIQGNFQGKAYKVRLPHLRGGNAQTVAIIELGDAQHPDTSYVIRRNVDEANNYRENVTKHPIIGEYVPKLYGIIEQWAVLEKITGLEGSELIAKMHRDKDFQTRYASKAVDLMQRVANARLYLGDVKTVKGHNCMVDPESADIQLIEQRSLEPSEFEPNELLFQQLEHELSALGTRTTDDVQAEYLVELMNTVFDRVEPQSLFMRTRLIKPSHPSFKQKFFDREKYLFGEYNDQVIEKKYQRIMDNPSAVENYTIPFKGNTERGDTETFSDEAITAIRERNISELRKLVATHRLKQEITDKTDTRYGAITIEDK